MTQIDSLQALDDVRRRSHSEPVVIYKHSATCGTSSFARREVRAFHQHSSVPVFEVVVQRARPVSDEVERQFGIRHESPQVIVLHRDRAVFHTSHGRIHAGSLEQAVKEAGEGVSES